MRRGAGVVPVFVPFEKRQRDCQTAYRPDLELCQLRYLSASVANVGVERTALPERG